MSNLKACAFAECEPLNVDEAVDVMKCSYCAKYYLTTHSWYCNVELYDYHVCKRCFFKKENELESFGYKLCICKEKQEEDKIDEKFNSLAI